MHEWYVNKKKYIDLFGGKLIYELPEPITFEVDNISKITKVTEFCDLVADTYGYQSLADFIYDNKDNFFTNIVNKDTHYKDFVIPKGMKIIKAFKYFVDDKEKLIEIQNKASMLIQEDKTTGTLCFSVHPLDYLSSSENTYNWQSCHSLDGQYRTGNLSYMADKSTIVCYLKGSDNFSVLPNFPENIKWNSKKWRMLLFANEKLDMIFAGRQYPFSSIGALNIVREEISKIFLTNYSPWSKEAYINFSGKQKTDYIRNSIETPYYYNDLTESIYYDCYYMYNDKQKNTIKPVIIGNKVKCIRCGKKKASSTEIMLCEKCYNK